VLVHLAVSDVHLHGIVGDDIPHHLGSAVDGLDAVVQIEDLPFAAKFKANRLADGVAVEAVDPRGHTAAVQRRRRQRADVAQTNHRHVQRPRNRCGRHRQDIDINTEALESFLVFDAETLLFVNDQQAEVFEANIVAEQAVGADQDIHLALSGGVENIPHLFGRRESVENFNRDGKFREAFGKGSAMLDTQHRRRGQHGDLLARLDGLKGRTHGQLGFAVADIAAQQAVHRNRFGHVAFDLVGGGQLVGRFLIRKGFFEFLLPQRIGPESKTAEFLPLSLHFQQFGGQFLHTNGDLLFLLFPFFGADTAEHRAARHGADEFMHEVNVGGGDVNPHLVGVFDGQVFAGAPGLFHHLDTEKTTDAIGHMDNVIALAEVHQAVNRRDRPQRADAPPDGGLAEQFVMADDNRSLAAEDKAL